MSEPQVETGPFQPPESAAALADAVPEHIGRYRVERLLGEGGFGLVYLAHDEQLHRPVAIKVPHARLLAQAGAADAYLTEARTVAALDHPNIVPVYDVGSTADSPCYVVSKYIDGTDLATRLKQSPLALHKVVELVATVAEALHYAHKQGLVHRDIKPGNILLDRGGRPFVADFGLALREQDVGRGPRFAGTPAYASPEQARGEGHRVDGRSDIFGLGVVFYELLTGRRPFRAESRDELLDQITSLEPRPPRQINDRIPRELDRICLKALAKRASERYSTATDLADDLRHFVAGASAEQPSTATGRQRNEAAAATPQPSPVPTPSDQQPVRIVPKGLRSFDAGDAGFFLELLPGPRDRDGLPDSIRFWKTRIEEMEPDNTFSVGLIYGPSGCGKSSLVKAGLLPRLASAVTAVYIEATGEETEARLLKGLRRQVPDLPGDLGLVESLAALRRGRFLDAGRKMLLVLDQFEQWLHVRRDEENTELVQALRQCDGGRVQGIVLVRDDFWMGATRFMQALEIRLVEGDNSAAIDLFDLLHTRKVLSAFGRAYGRLPDNLSKCSKDQDAFLDQAVSGLAEGGKVISVWLALFAEMVKGKPWTPATLKEVGGTAGVGVTFLEETFAAPTAPPQHRLHQRAAQAVLKALLPDAGTDIKGHMRSQQELLEASGYANRPPALDELLRILDSEIRLITPTDPEGKETVDPPTTQADVKYYQLTHDYLVPSLREWLTRKQKETRRGRAELLLADRASLWNARRENRQLPSLWQWFRIRWLTWKKNWTPPQRMMMRRATRYHAVRGLVVAVMLALVGWAGYEGHGTLKAHALSERLLDADTTEVPTIVQEMAPYRSWLDPLLRDANQEAEAQQEGRKRLHTSLALLPVDSSQVGYLYGRLLDAAPHEVAVLRDALAPHRHDLLDKLWGVAEHPPMGQVQQRLRAACALARFDPDSERWAKVGERVANDLVGAPTVHIATWMDALRLVHGWFVAPLVAVFRDGKRREAERYRATDILTDYAADHPAVLADLLLDADEKQFAALLPKFKEHGNRGLPPLLAEVDRRLPPAAPDGAKEKLAKRQANAGVALLRLGQAEKAWPLLKHGPDPRTRSYLIHRLAPFGVEAGAIRRRLDEEPDVTIRRALVLSLGQFGEEALPRGEQEVLMEKMRGLYRTVDDPGLHAAAEWLLRHWKHGDWLRTTDEAWAKDKEQRSKTLGRIRQELAKRNKKPQWYVNGQGQTMVVIPGPVEFVIGSPPTEEGRSGYEVQHRKRIGRTFALATKTVTTEQFRRFSPEFRTIDAFRHPDPACPVAGITWYEAAGYCNWLSEQEGIPRDQWCYETNGRGHITKLRTNYLALTGYRLPTEAEWEYACRAKAVTSRFYGNTEELLEKYAWYAQNSGLRSWPGGAKKPNDFGLFDMHGNVWNWCQEVSRDYPQGEGKSFDDREDSLIIYGQEIRAARGGAFGVASYTVRCATRYGSIPGVRYDNIGIRPARTFR
ncbi:MAG TPA: SUMF1/EgtB/PvdO family nonheme iron enzyme [Gemmataceae bacterium]|jgi:serine/threonine protein kinase/formylglycine-generating enzyme required for sulfatase activity|nr:SUMF1/EgtB/PvdO family nonheme iron enzyme [Gemmataceae bacterium]